MYRVQRGCWLLTPFEWVACLGMGTSTARGARFPVPNRSYPAEPEPARSSPIHPIARLSGSERLRRSTAKILLALLYMATELWVNNGSGMACWLTAPSHCLNQCWQVISNIHWQSQEIHQSSVIKISLKIKFHSNLPESNRWNLL